MAASIALLDDSTAENILEQLLKPWRPPVQAGQPGSAAQQQPRRPGAVLRTHNYPALLPTLRPTSRDAGGARRRPSAARDIGSGFDGPIGGPDPDWQPAERVVSFDDVWNNVAAGTSSPAGAIDDTDDAGLQPGEAADDTVTDEQRFTARIVALETAGKLAHPMVDAGASDHPASPIGGYSFFSDEPGQDIERDHVSALSALFNADLLSARQYQAGDHPSRPRPFKIPSLPDDDRTEELSMNSIFL